MSRCRRPGGLVANAQRRLNPHAESRNLHDSMVAGKDHVGHESDVAGETGVGGKAPESMHRPGTIDLVVHGELYILSAAWDRATKQHVRE